MVSFVGTLNGYDLRVTLPPAFMQSNANDPATPPRHQCGTDINAVPAEPNRATDQYEPLVKVVVVPANLR